LVLALALTGVAAASAFLSLEAQKKLTGNFV
jgi:hypothetical protein